MINIFFNDDYICIDNSGSPYCFSTDEYGNPDCSLCKYGIDKSNDDKYNEQKDLDYGVNI